MRARIVVNHIAIAIAILTFGGVVQAQNCYTPVISLKGQYNLATSATAACDAGTGTGTCTFSQSVVGSPNFGAPMVQSGCRKLVEGSLKDTIVSSSMNDNGVFPCGNGTTFTDDYVGTSAWGLVNPTILTIDLSKGSYTFGPEPAENATETISGCISGTGTGFDALFPTTNWPPPAFPLPANVQALKVDNFGFQGGSLLPVPNISIPWTFSLTLSPDYECEACKQQGGEGLPVSSSISTENQSLGEDVPIVGTGFYLHYEGSRASGGGGNGTAAADALMIGGWTLNVHHAYDAASNTLYLGDGSRRSGYEIGNPLFNNGNFLITSRDGGEVYAFSLTTGVHVETLRPMTGALQYKFGYDAAGKLVSITDAMGNVTTIQRNASEQPTAMVSPYGQTTTLAVDSNGLLSQVTDPLGKSAAFVNTTGQLSSRTDENGNVFTYTYDGNGKLIKDADPLGGYTALTRTDATSGFGWTVGETTSMGRTSSYQPTLTLPWLQDGTAAQSEQHTNTWPNGLQASSSNGLQSGLLSNSATLPGGTSINQTLGPDPVWGIQSPVLTSETLTQGNLTMNITGSRSTVLGTAGNPFSVTTMTDTHAVNGRTFTSTYTGANRTYVAKTPVGRTMTVGLDSLERTASLQTAGLTATDFAYDSHGRLSSATQGPRKTTYSYDTDGLLASVTDPLKQTTSFAYDADGQLLSNTLPDGRIISYAYDANGNLTSVTPPGKAAHEFTYNAVDLLDSYTPAAVSGTGATTYAYDLDRDLTTITRPDGKKISYGYDTAGRLSSVTTPNGTLSYAYDATTGNLESVLRVAERVTYTYNGPLPTKTTWKGTVAGSVGRTFNDNFWMVSQNVGGGSTVPLVHDNDGLLTKAGPMVVKRSAKNGFITGTTLGVTSDSRTYDSFGALIAYSASVNGAPVYSVTFTRDAGGRITAKTETIGAVTNSYSYSYDLGGRLTAATKNAAINTYTYDSNSNRLSATTSSGTTNGTYDAQDRLLTYGNDAFTYTANGELASQSVGNQKTTYTYDVLGNLIGATLANGTKLTYIIDGQSRRVGKEASGVLKTGFLYEGSHVMAQLNGSNQLVSQFVYGTGSTSPAYMISGGATYRIFSDQLGSPIVVVNSSTGAIVEQITYDEFGNVLTDTNPGFQPFGFAGGLYDADTKLVRFDARDYNPHTGRWSAKDPILFAGGDPNLYGYAFADPVNLIDPAGTGGTDGGTVDAGTPASQPAEAGTPDAPSLGDELVSEIAESLTILKRIEAINNKCKKVAKYAKAISNGREGVAKALQSEATGKVPSRASDEQVQLQQNISDKDVPAVKDLANSLISGGKWNQAIDATKPCPCKAQQTKAPDARPPQWLQQSQSHQFERKDYE
jgi:RHS repeat-associated protein